MVVWFSAGVSASEGWSANPGAVLKQFRPAKLGDHEKDVNCVKWYPNDANVMASCSIDNTVRIWTAKDTRLSSWSCVATLEVGQSCYAIDWHPSGRALLVAHCPDFSNRKQISIFVLNSCAASDSDFDRNSWERTAALKGHTNSSDPVGSVLWHPSGMAFASSGSDGAVRVWCQPPHGAGSCRWNCVASFVGAEVGGSAWKNTQR